MAIYIAVNSYVPQSYNRFIKKKKYRNLNLGHNIVLLLEIEKAKFPIFRTVNTLNNFFDMCEMFELILYFIIALIFEVSRE